MKERSFVYYSSTVIIHGSVEMSLLERSLLEHRPLEVIYMSKDGKFSKRQIMVRSIHDSYVRAYCLRKRQIRTFRRESILSMQFL
ncbi:WYL domain-containing protein [Bacillus sp. FJAT-47783]|uniref:WYL domain-containing protein n=1 Tax=Bacillus sp. FJAT-47783 TaxID=2922712 RepID=UPI001FAD31ED|nr:WYL domain-containing protein [Bacillus sp. FJAT-47783]